MTPTKRLKELVIKRLSVSDTPQLNPLLTDFRLGELTFSHPLREMKQLGEDEVGTELLKSLLSQRLPESTQVKLACANDSFLEVSAATTNTLSVIFEDVPDPHIRFNFQTPLHCQLFILLVDES